MPTRASPCWTRRRTSPFSAAPATACRSTTRTGQKTPFYLDALICEPDFAAKLKSGAQDGSKCLACNGCYTIYRKRFVRCVQHQDEIEQFKTIPW